ncbi:serine/arginine repetitive matrix protein 1, partial [Actinomyces oris]
MRFSAVDLRHLGIRVARTAWSSRLFKTALVFVVITVFLTLAQAWAQQRPVMASSLTQPEAPAYSTWQASAEANETTSCDTSTGTSPEPGTQWSEAWRFDSGTDPSATLSSPVIHRCGNYLVVESRGEKGALRGYLLDKAGPKKLWELTDKSINLWGSPWWGGHLVLNHEILDPATGRTETAPWSSDNWPYIISPHLIITCDSYWNTNRCSAWDWSGG